MNAKKNHVLTLLSLLLMLPALSGCIALAAGGAAGGTAGYYIAKEDRPSEQVGRDDELTKQVRARFAADPDLAPLSIHIEVYDEVATLSGDVPNGMMAQRAIDAAHNVPGVKGVRSELAVH